MQNILKPYGLSALIAILAIAIAALSQLSFQKAPEKAIAQAAVHQLTEHALAEKSQSLSIETADYFDQAIINESLAAGSLERSLKETSTLFALVFSMLGLSKGPVFSSAIHADPHSLALSTPVYILYRKLIL